MKVPPSYPGHPIRFQGQNSPAPDDRQLLKKYSFDFDRFNLPEDSPRQGNASAGLLDFDWFPPTLNAGDFLETSPQPELPVNRTTPEKEQTPESPASSLTPSEPAAVVTGKRQREKSPEASPSGKGNIVTDKLSNEASSDTGTESAEIAPPKPKRVRHNDSSRQVAEARQLYQNNTPLGEIARKFTVHRSTLNRWLGLEDSTEQNKQAVLDLHRQKVPQREMVKKLDLPLPKIVQFLKEAGLVEQRKKTYQRYDDETRQEAVLLRKQGIGFDEIASRLNVHKTSAMGWAAQAGLAVPRKKLDLEKVRQLKDKGYNQSKIAEELGCSREAVTKQFKKFRVKPRCVQHTEEQRAKVLELYNQNLQLKEIARITQIPEGTVAGITSKAGLKNRAKPGMTLEQKQKAYEMRQQGYKMPEIVKTVGFSQPTITKAIQWVEKQPVEQPQPEATIAPVSPSVNALSRWGALLLATSWARKLIQGKNRRQNEKLETEKQRAIETRVTESETRHKTNPFVLPSKRKATESEQQLDVVSNNPEAMLSAPVNKKRRLFRANGEAVRPLRTALSISPPLEKQDEPSKTARFWREPSPAAIPRETVAPGDRSRKGGRFEARFDQETREKALDLKRQNKPVSQIEKLTGVAQRTLGKWFKDAGLTKAQNVNFTPHDEAKKRQALELREQGLHTERISERLGVSPNTLKTWFAAQGLNQERKTYSPAIKNKVLDLYKKDTPIPEIAEEMDVPTGRIYAWITESGQANRRKPHNQETRQQVFSLYQAKKTIPAIVSATGVSEATVVKWLKEEGLSNRRKLHDASVIEQAVSRYKKGENRQEISKSMGIPVPTLKKWLVKAGLVNHRS